MWPFTSSFNLSSRFKNLRLRWRPCSDDCCRFCQGIIGAWGRTCANSGSNGQISKYKWSTRQWVRWVTRVCRRVSLFYARNQECFFGDRPFGVKSTINRKLSTLWNYGISLKYTMSWLIKNRTWLCSVFPVLNLRKTFKIIRRRDTTFCLESEEDFAVSKAQLL